MDSTKPESLSATTSQPSEQTNASSVTTPDVPDRVHIEPPAKGEVRVVDVQNADEIAFNFDLKTVRVSAIDVDLVLLFPDNSKLILPGLAMSLLGAKAPKLRSLNELIHSQDIVSAISQVNLAETTPSIHLASSDFLPKKQGGNAADDKASADGSENAESSRAAAEVVVTPVRPNVVIEINKTNSASGAKVEAVEAGSIASSKLNLANAGGEPPAPKNPPPSSNSQANSAAQGNAPFSMNAADLKIKALAIAETSETPQSDGKILVGGSGDTAAAEDASFAAQTARESLSGGSGNDLIISGIEGDFLDGADTVIASQGDDTVYSGQGADNIRTEIGDDLVYAESGADIIDLGDGNDTADGGTGADSIIGGSGNDRLLGAEGSDCIIGTGGSDIMRGGSEHDYMLIDQTFLGGGGSIDGGTGSDTLSFAANSGNLTLTNANFDNIVTNVEVLDFTSIGTNVTMSLNATDIASLTGQGLGVNNKLDIFQNAGDQISIATQAGYSFDTTTSNGVTTYTFYNSTDPHDPANQMAQINVHGS